MEMCTNAGTTSTRDSSFAFLHLTLWQTLIKLASNLSTLGTRGSLSARFREEAGNKRRISETRSVEYERDKSARKSVGYPGYNSLCLNKKNRKGNGGLKTRCN